MVWKNRQNPLKIYVKEFSFRVQFRFGGFKFAIKSVINLSFRIYYQAYCHDAKKPVCAEWFNEKVDIPDLLQTVALVVKLQGKSHQRCLLIYHLCCYPHSRRKIRKF